MYVHTNTGCAAFSPCANIRAPAACALDSFFYIYIYINKGISIELLLKLMETDGCCCLQV